MAPILLLDDIIEHLDKKRRAALFLEVSRHNAQSWFTSTSKDAFAGYPSFIDKINASLFTIIIFWAISKLIQPLFFRIKNIENIIKKEIFIPDTKIIDIHVAISNIVWPISGWYKSKIEIIVNIIKLRP